MLIMKNITLNPPKDSSSGHADPFAEHTWLRDFQQGNESAFNHILERYTQPVMSFAFRFLGNRDDAEDATQEIFIKIFHSSKKYSFSGKLSTWIFTIAANHCRNIIRKRKILSFFPLNIFASDDYPPHEIPDTAQKTPLHEAEQSELSRAVNAALASLSDTQRSAILLSKYENMSLEEIARILRVSTGAVKQLIFRAKLRLKDTLKNYIPPSH